MDKRKFINLIKKHEGIKLDFKQALDLETESGRKELVKDICAIANSKGGRGYLIIGIEDKTKRIVGIGDLDLQEEKIQQIVSSRSEPPVPISLEFIEYDSKKIGIINIYDGPQKPYQLRENGVFYIRRGSTNDTMRKQEIAAALLENLNLNVELCPIVQSNLNCLDKDLVSKYFLSQGISINEGNYIELMENASIIYTDKESGKHMITLGGILIFSRINNVYIPHNMIKIINKVNKNLDENIIIQGNLISMLDKCELVLNSLLPKSYPIEAVYEGIKNAVLYRDYTLYDRVIEIIIDYSSISIISPGILLKGQNYNSNNFLKRNMWIYEKIITLDEKKRFIKYSKGVTRIQKVFRNKGRVNFVNSFSEDSFKVIYPGIKKFK